MELKSMKKLFFVVLIVSIFSVVSYSQNETIGGVYEIGIGTKDIEAQIKYWERFGYKVGKRGDMSEKDAERLYGVKSKLKSARLVHQDSDHGLIRLFQWAKPTNNGLQMSRMNVLGNRWGATLTSDVYNLLNHAEEAAAQKKEVFSVEPQRAEIYKLEKRPVPFLENYATVREMCLIQPETRQILFQRFGYSLPLYGKIDQDSFFKSSQFTHVGMVIYRNQENIDFYENVLGLLKVKENANFDSDYNNPSSRAIFSLEKNQKYGATDFDDPRSSKIPAEARSGRLKIIWFSPESKLTDKFASSKPGSLGYSLYTYRVKGIEDYRKRVKASKAKGLTETRKNEFGEKSFSFVAPDGYFWTMVE
jgi:catechol 2,3-dioxygenase-like lactoylglutathione lyase family enzyme